jgi:hypothetical protein
MDVCFPSMDKMNFNRRCVFAKELDTPYDRGDRWGARREDLATE